MAILPRRWTLWKRTSDAEHIEGLRQVLARYDRWKPWLLGLYAVAAIGWIGLVIVVAEITQWIKNGLLGWVGLGVGLTLGFTLGMLAAHIIHGLLGSIVDRFHNERLLIRYHDTIQASLTDPPPPPAPRRTVSVSVPPRADKRS